MKKAILTGLAAVTLAAAARATLYSYDFTTGLNNGGVIPDGNTAGWSDTRNISLALPDPANGTTTEITDVNVRLNISGGYNGDLYGYLVHSSGFAVLLNRSGRTGSDAFGYGDAGFNITLDGQAATYDKDIHLYNAATPAPGFSSGRLTGTWLEDGRNANPASVTDANSRGALLSSFNTLDANGTWTLFLADMSAGDTSTLVSWGLDISVVPEPTTWALIGFGGMAGAAGLRRWFSRRTKNG